MIKRLLAICCLLSTNAFSFSFPNDDKAAAAMQAGHYAEAYLLLDEGSILLGSGNYSIRFRPHLNVTEDDINFGMDCFRRALNKLS